MAAVKRALHWLENDDDVSTPEVIQILSPYLYEVHTFLFYCRLGSSCKRARLLKSVTWICTIWLFSIKWTINCEKTYFIIFLNSDSDCFIRSLLRTERGGAKAGAQARWPPLLRGKTKPLCCLILLIFKLNYLSFVRWRGSDWPHGCAPSTCVRKTSQGL